MYFAGSKDAAQQLMLAGQLRPFHGLRFVPGHGQTDYGRWLSATAPYPVQYEEVCICQSHRVVAWADLFGTTDIDQKVAQSCLCPLCRDLNLTYWLARQSCHGMMSALLGTW